MSDDFRQAVNRGDYNGDRNDFKRDALAALGISDHPKADIAYRLAWDWGHSAGYSEVLIYLEDLLELLIP